MPNAPTAGICNLSFLPLDDFGHQLILLVVGQIIKNFYCAVLKSNNISPKTWVKKTFLKPDSLATINCTGSNLLSSTDFLMLLINLTGYTLFLVKKVPFFLNVKFPFSISNSCFPLTSHKNCRKHIRANSGCITKNTITKPVVTASFDCDSAVSPEKKNKLPNPQNRTAQMVFLELFTAQSRLSVDSNSNFLRLILKVNNLVYQYIKSSIGLSNSGIYD